MILQYNHNISRMLKLHRYFMHIRRPIHNQATQIVSTSSHTLPPNVVFSKNNNLFRLVHSAIIKTFSNNFTISIRRISTSSTRFSDAFKSDDKSSIPSKKVDASATNKSDGKNGVDKTIGINDKDVTATLNASPLEVQAKAGKLIVSAIEAFKANEISISGGSIGDEAKKQQAIEISTKKGKLFVIATTNDDKLADVVLAKEKIMTADASTTASNANNSKANGNSGGGGSTIKPVVKPRRERVDFSRSSLERNFITPARAMSDFLLKLSDLESLPKTKRRSPYEQEPPIIVYWRKDVEAKAIEVWGSRENLLRECLKREIEKKRHQQNIFTVKRRLRDYRREMGSRTNVDFERGLRGRSGRVVITAIVINATNFIFKIFAWLYTGSHSMFAESIHSFADTTNQIILAYGIHKSTQNADPDHPYGYSNMKYVSSLISGVGIFCVGTGLSFYHGIMGLMHPVDCGDFYWAFWILGGSLISEGATLLVAVNSIRHSAKLANTTFREFVIRGQDPSVNVVLFEDAAAVASVFLAAGCMGLSMVSGSSVPDAVGSLLVGCMLGGVASFIISTNVQALVGRSIPDEHLDKINAELESDIMIRAIHDVKGIDMGNSLVRYKAELDFDGRELTRFYLDKQDLSQLLEEVKSFSSIEELETFLLKHGESIVDLMGGEIDRIELKLRKKFPEIRHCDLEIL